MVKNTITSIALILLLSACAGSGGGSSGGSPGTAYGCATFEGIYDNVVQVGHTLTVRNDCTFTDSTCAYVAGFTLPNQTTGATTMTIAGTNGTPGCMSSTTHACLISYNGDDLNIDCDSGANQFFFDKR